MVKHGGESIRLWGCFSFGAVEKLDGKMGGAKNLEENTIEAVKQVETGVEGDRSGMFTFHLTEI